MTYYHNLNSPKKPQRALDPQTEIITMPANVLFSTQPRFKRNFTTVKIPSEMTNDFVKA